jgi:hypothetical protein
MDNGLFSPVGAQSSDSESLDFIFKTLLSGMFFFEIVQVKAVRGNAPSLVVDVLPLLSRTDRTGAQIDNSIIYSIPVWRLQRGGSAIIMNPVVGDIGVIAVCDRDTSLVVANRKQSVPSSKRTHSKSDSIYFGGVLNMPPSQFIEFSDGSINVTSPNPVNITCSKANITAPDGVEMTTPLLKVSGMIEAGGDIIDNSSSQSVTVKQARDAYNDHTHNVSGVQSGGDTKTSSTTSDPT